MEENAKGGRPDTCALASVVTPLTFLGIRDPAVLLGVEGLRGELELLLIRDGEELVTGVGLEVHERHVEFTKVGPLVQTEKNSVQTDGL